MLRGWGNFTVTWLQYVHSETEKVPDLSLFSSKSLFCLRSVDSEVLSGAGRPVGGAGPDGDPVLCSVQLLGHCSVDQRWTGSGHWKGPTGWDIIQPPWASFTLFSMRLRRCFLSELILVLLDWSCSRAKCFTACLNLRRCFFFKCFFSRFSVHHNYSDGSPSSFDLGREDTCNA